MEKRDKIIFSIALIIGAPLQLIYAIIVYIADRRDLFIYHWVFAIVSLLIVVIPIILEGLDY